MPRRLQDDGFRCGKGNGFGPVRDCLLRFTKVCWGRKPKARVSRLHRVYGVMDVLSPLIDDALAGKLDHGVKNYFALWSCVD